MDKHTKSQIKPIQINLKTIKPFRTYVTILKILILFHYRGANKMLRCVLAYSFVILHFLSVGINFVRAEDESDSASSASANAG